MRKIVNIVLGWWFWITNRNDHIARGRLSYCTPCIYRKGMICKECGCVLQAKARLRYEDCPKKIWPSYFTFLKDGTSSVL